MTERPILFSGPMVKALLAGTKTQTRRALREGTWLDPKLGVIRMCSVAPGVTGFQEVDCPYGRPGDKLWVRETFFAWGRWEKRFNAKKARDEWHFVDMTLESGHSYLYAADGVRNTQAFIKRRGDGKPMYWQRPSIHMPRVASRITLEVTAVRVERLQDISEADALAEGIVKLPDGGYGLPDGSHYHFTDPRISYWSLWDAINGLGATEANPWVWAVSFKRVESA